MSFQAYLDNIKLKTGKSPAEFKRLATKNGLLLPGVKAGEIVRWLKKDFNLGHGHAMAIFTYFKGHKQNKEAIIEKHFRGGKQAWKSVFESLTSKLKGFDNSIVVDTAESYFSLLKNNKKFAVIKITAGRMDIGLKLKGIEPTARLEASGNWNNLVTHRIKINSPKQIDAEVMNWLKLAIYHI